MTTLMRVLIHANSGNDISGRRWYFMRKPVLMYVDTGVNVVEMRVFYAVIGIDVWECRC